MVSCCVLLLAVAVVAVPSVTGSQYVVSEVIPREGDEYTMHCGGSGDLEYFFLHQEGDGLVPAYYETLQIIVFRNASVFFESISLTHEGIHNCIRKEDSKIKSYPTHLRVRAKPPEDLWGEVYEAKFVTGFLAALVIGALFALGCLVYKYRWVPKGTDTSPIIVNSGYVNPAMDKEDAESGCSTKM